MSSYVFRWERMVPPSALSPYLMAAGSGARSRLEFESDGGRWGFYRLGRTERYWTKRSHTRKSRRRGARDLARVSAEVLGD